MISLSFSDKCIINMQSCQHNMTGIGTLSSLMGVAKPASTNSMQSSEAYLPTVQNGGCYIFIVSIWTHIWKHCH